MTTLGTAGHIDHGKTALIKALTGVDTDRLPEERERGVSIALGYAPLELPSGRRLSVVDVPGHERFVRTMVAGATGIDLYLMTIAADDGVMPQTREHATVLDALGVEVGVVAVTKADLAAPTQALVEAGELLPGAEAVAVSARTGAGLDELRAALDRAAERAASRAEAPGGVRLHVDRVFTIRGAGTVVTGTLWAGSVGRGDSVTIQPAGRPARVRSVEVHDEPVERADAGQRVALNLAGVDRDEVRRGDVIVTGGEIMPTYRVDAALQLRERPALVAVHHGTRESPARLAELGGRYFQLRLEQPIVPVRGDRLVIRSLAPPDTIGGGVVLDPAPRRHGPSRALTARLAALERGETPVEEPPPPPPPREAPAPPPLTESARAAEARLNVAEPPLDSEFDAADLAALRAHGRIVRLGPAMHVHTEALAAVRARIVAAIERDGTITLAGARDELGTSRKYAQAYLEHLDRERVTLRRGDERVLRRRSANA
jgi:selenocysteine-specific elongation factor